MKINSTSYTPAVFYNENENLFLIEGRSFPENAKDFYIPIIEWILTNPFKSEITYKINLEYFNTASSKFILESLYAFEKIMKEENIKVVVEWCFAAGDDDMKEAGSEFKQIVTIPFILKEI